MFQYEDERNRQKILPLFWTLSSLNKAPRKNHLPPKFLKQVGLSNVRKSVQKINFIFKTWTLSEKILKYEIFVHDGN